MYLVCTVLQETHLEGVSSVSLTRYGLIVHLITSLIYNILSTDVFGMYCAPGNTSRGCVQCPSGKEWVDCTLDPCEREKAMGCPLHKTENPTCV